MTSAYIVWRRMDGMISASNKTVRPGTPIQQLMSREFHVYGVFTVWRHAKICIWAQMLAQGWVPDYDSPEARYPNPPHSPVRIPCEAFLLCENMATRLIDHPTLIKVPSCDRCAERLGHAILSDEERRRRLLSWDAQDDQDVARFIAQGRAVLDAEVAAQGDKPPTPEWAKENTDKFPPV